MVSAGVSVNLLMTRKPEDRVSGGQRWMRVASEGTWANPILSEKSADR